MCSWWRCGKAASQVFRVTLEQGDMRDTNKKERVLAKADLNLTRKKALSFLHKACSFSRPSVSKKA